jgi:hypothetical protein
MMRSVAVTCENSVERSNNNDRSIGPVRLAVGVGRVDCLRIVCGEDRDPGGADMIGLPRVQLGLPGKILQ